MGAPVLGPRARRAVAGLGVLAFLTFYVWAVVSIGALLPDNALLHLLFYGISGIAWGVPLLPLLSWAEKKPK
jgi:hypothetical protein